MAHDDHHKHFVGQIAQKALIEQDGKILLVQYPMDDIDVVAGKWDLPGGRLHIGETSIEGVKREVKEEIGTAVEIDGILTAGVNVVRDDFKLFFVIYRAHLLKPTALLKPEEGEIGAIDWKTKEEFFNIPLLYEGYRDTLRPLL